MEVEADVSLELFVLPDIVWNKHEGVTVDPDSIWVEYLSDFVNSASYLLINFFEFRPVINWCF